MVVKHEIVAETKPIAKTKKKVSKAEVARLKAKKKSEKIENKAQQLEKYYRNPAVVIGGELNLKQREFCNLFVDYDRELFGNGARCYLAVYGADHFRKHQENMEYSVAQACSSRLLSNAMVIEYINSKLEEGGFNDVNVDKQLLFIINQNADLRAKIAGIKEFNNLRKRVDNRPVMIQGNTITFQKFTK